MAALNEKSIRKDFPILKKKVHGKPLTFLDSASTSQKPKQVIAALTDFYENTNANVHRGIYTLSEEATQAFELTRKKVAGFIGAKFTQEIIFTRNTTEGLNLVAQAFGKQIVTQGDTILVTEMEHHSNLLPWQVLTQEKKAKLAFVPVLKNGLLDMDAAKMLLAQKPKLFALTHVSNMLGTVNPIKELVQLAHRQGIPVVVDGAQSVPHMAIDVQELDVDFFVFSAHKMLGPTGVGVVYGKKKYLEQMQPFLAGGGMIKEVEYNAFSVQDLPWKFEAGTPSVADVVAFGAAIEYLQNIGMENVYEHTKELTAYAYEQMSKLPFVQVYGPKPEQRLGVIAFNCVDASKKIIHPHDVVAILDEDGIAVRSGHHCVMPLHAKWNLPSTTRMSFYIYTTKEEIDRAVASLQRMVAIFNKTLEVVSR